MTRTFGSVLGRPSLLAHALLGLLLPATGCVIGRSERPTLTEAVRGPSAAPVSGAPVVAQTAPAVSDDDAPTPAKPGALWVRGYYHWDGVRYVWQRARWESSSRSTP